jgi:transcriptional regulator with XRE-family HTH domain
MTAGRDLRYERQLRGLTQAEMAERLGTDRATIVRKEQQAEVNPLFVLRYREALQEKA